MKPAQRHLYRVSSVIPVTGTSLLPAKCITCVVVPAHENHTLLSDLDEYHLGISSSGHSLGKDTVGDWSDQVDAPEEEQQEQEEDTTSDITAKRKKNKKTKQGL